MPAPYPTPHVAGLHRYQRAGQAADESSVGGWLPPRDEAGEQVRVIGWAPVGPSYEDQQTGSPVIKVEMYVTATIFDTAGNAVADPGPLDYVDLPEGAAIRQYEVVGWPRDYTHSPFPFRPGKVVDLQRSIL